MPIDLRNTNTVWASIIVETLHKLGLKTVIICPGSRHTPLAVAFATHPDIEAIAILDERSAAFFGLGIAKKTNLPVVIICTSGTAGANFYPAIIEAKESRVSFIVFTGDRPPEMRECHSGQAIDQIKLYGNYPHWQTELATPSLDLNMLAYLRQTMIYAWERSRFPTPGPIHINIPFRDPLAPILQPEAQQLEATFSSTKFWQNCQPLTSDQQLSQPDLIKFIKTWSKCEKGLIIVGISPHQNRENYCQNIADIAHFLGWPVCADALTPLRNYRELNPYLIATYDLILRSEKIAEKLAPEMVIQIGDLPTSKELRNWLNKYQPLTWIIDQSDHNLDPLHGHTVHLRIAIELLAKSLNFFLDTNKTYCQKWQKIAHQVSKNIQKIEAIETLIEPKIAWLLPQILPPETPIFIANSMPVRDIEFLWPLNHKQIQPYCNRGANGIDGTLSTALGIAYRQPSSILLTGDLALLHDTNGFLIKPKMIGHLTIILINNNGGGIFEMLPISQFDPPFEEFFATPQTVNFAQLCASYQVEYELITSWDHCKSLLNPLPPTGIRLLEIPTNRKADTEWRKTNLGKFAQSAEVLL